MEKRTLYDNGLPFSSPLERDLKALTERVELNKASLIIIDGGLGEGKTTLAVQCADYIQGSEINFKDQIGMGGKEFVKQMKVCYQKNLKVVIYDEAGDFNGRGALTRFNSTLNSVFDTYRAFKVIIIVVLPDFTVLDKPLYRKGIVRFLLHCHGRNSKYGNFSAYNLWRMYYILHKMKKLVVKTDAFRFTVPNFKGHFLDLSKERSKELEKFSTDKKLEMLSELNAKMDGLLTFNEISKRIGRSVVWVQAKIKELNLEPKMVHKRRKFFDEVVADTLGDLVSNSDFGGGKQSL